MASLLLGNLGSSLLGPLGGFIGSAIGSYIDNLLFAPKPPDIEGPRLTDLNAVRADPGVPLPIVYGTDRVPGIVIDSTDIIETKHKQKVGGKGGPKQTQISYTYHVDIDFMLCEGPILGVGRIWADGKLVRGTRYEMSLQAETAEEKAGAIPYSNWYLQQYYDETLLPWSLDPSYTPTIGVQKYTYDPISDVYTPISDGEAAAILADPTDVTVIYAQESDTGYYIPIPASHDYTGEVITECQDHEVLFPGSYNSFQDFTGSEGGDGSTLPVVADNTVYSTSWVNEGPAHVEHANDEFTSVTLINSAVFHDFDLHDMGITQSIINAGSVKVSFNWSGTYLDGGVLVTRQVTFYEDDGGVPLQPGSTEEQAHVITSTASETVEITVPTNIRFVQVRFSLVDEVSINISDIRFQWITPTPCPLVRDWPDYENFYDAINDWSPIAVLEFHGPEGVAFYRGTDDQISDPTMQLVHTGDISCDVPAYIGRAHIVFQRLELEDFGNRIPNFTFEIVQSDNARIRLVLEDLMNRAEMDADLYDLTALPETGVPSHVLGYTVAKVTSFRAAMETLLEAFNIDCAEMGNQLVFRPKNREYDHTIDYSDLAAIEAGGKGNGVAIKISLRDPIEMPKRLTIRYRDPEREYQVNTAVAARQFTQSVQESSAELSAVLPPYIAKQYARDKLRSLWYERKAGSWTAPHKYLYISPSDKVFINGSDYGKADFVFRVTSVSRAANGILSMEGVIKETNLYSPVEGETDAVGTDNLWHPQIGGTRVPATYTKLLNLPPLRESDNDAGFYYGMSGQSGTWNGATLNRQLTSQSAYELLGLLTNGTVLGFAETGLGYFATPGLLDTTNTIVVQLYNASDVLSSITAEELLSTKLNVAVIGEEIIQFMNATDLGSGRWELSNLLRGHLDTGTEEILSGHLAHDSFVLLEEFTLGNHVEDISFAFNPYPYKGVTVNSQISQFSAQEFTNSAERLRPFRPFGVTGVRDVSNNLTISWIRQDRLVYSMVDGADIPISEDYEQYEVEILDGTTVVRTFVVDDATEVAYTAAAQTSDGLTPGDPVSLNIYQMSAILGRGNMYTGEV
jgi:hypothetical protein